MIAPKTRPISICTWSLQNDFEQITSLMNACAIHHVHLDLCPIGTEADYLDRIGQQPWAISAAMIGFPQEDYSTLESIRKTGGIVPDDGWPRNKAIVFSAIEAAAELKVPYLSSHIGFLDYTQPEAYRALTDRVRCLADKAGEMQMMILMETGQETADELRDFLETLDHPAVGVNFDPANMILYDKGDPIQAVRTLAPWIRHVHIKDALQTETPGTWGTEAAWGTGQVGPAAFMAALDEIGYTGAMAVEREAGDQRAADIRMAIENLKQF